MTPDEARVVRDRARRDPEWWAKEALGVALWSQQVGALCSWRDNRHTSWRSCNGAGKTLTDAVGVLWIGSNWEDTSILTTATTFTQVKGSLWGEISHLVENARWPLGCRALTTEIYWPHGSRAFAITAPPQKQHTAKMQGYRGRVRTFVLGDEASGLSDSILEGIDSMLTGAAAHKMLTGNPLDPNTEFKRTFDRPNVVALKTDAFSTPNLSTFGITLDDIIKRTWPAKVTGPYPNPALTTPEWVEEFFDKCGRSVADPIFMARVLAEFPEESEDALIPWRFVVAALARDLKASELDPKFSHPNELGVDVARTGNDSTVIYHRHGPIARRVAKIHGQDTMAVAGAVVLARRETGATLIKVDVIGIGAGVADRLRELGEPVEDINVGSGSNDPERYMNLRSELFWAVRQRFEDGDIVLSEADSREVVEQLHAMRWKPNSRGQIVVEPKNETKKRLDGKSPDEADALMLAFAPSQRKAFVFL